MLTAGAAPSITFARSTWSISGAYETDSKDSHGAVADVFWSPAESLALSVAAGTLKSSAKEGGFTARTGAAAVDWSPFRYVSATAGYSLWDDRDTYAKETFHYALYTGSDLARIGFVAESVRSDAKAEDIVLRGKRVRLAFDGMGYGLDGWLTVDHVSIYASYMGYHYGDRVRQLLAFLSDPNLAKRPKLANLANSGLTTAGALLHRSVIAGTDIFVGQQRIGVSWSEFHEIVTDTRTNVGRVEYEWPISRAWTTQLNAGASQTAGFGKTWFGGARFTFYGH